MGSWVSKLDTQFIKAKSLSAPYTIDMEAYTSAVVAAFSVVLAAEVWQILAVLALMFFSITVAALWFAHSSSKIESKKEIQKRKIDVVDRHFNDMLRIECPYCQTIYKPDEPECPNCKASIRNVIFPEMPE